MALRDETETAKWIEDYMDENGGEIPDDVLQAWTNCPIPDCHYKQCLWSGTVYCAVHARELIGDEEMDRRYAETHSKEPK